MLLDEYLKAHGVTNGLFRKTNGSMNRLDALEMVVKTEDAVGDRVKVTDPESLIGRHNDVSDTNFDPKELQKGIETESEHTDDPEIAKAIAKDHLFEIPDYYVRLEAMEASAKTGDENLNAEDEGWVAAKSGKDVKNPYPSNSMKSKEWQKGFEEGLKDRKFRLPDKKSKDFYTKNKDADEKYVISDMGEELIATSMIDEKKQPDIKIPRYGVWRLEGSTMKEVVETSNDLNMLKSKYHTDRVVKIKGK